MLEEILKISEYMYNTWNLFKIIENICFIGSDGYKNIAKLFLWDILKIFK